MREVKAAGFSDFQIARFVLKGETNMEQAGLKVRARRKRMDIVPAIKRIETVGGEAVVLPVQLFGQYQLRQSSEMREVAARHKAVV